MPITEVVEVNIKASGAKGTSRQLKNVGTVSRTATRAVSALVTALGAIGVGLSIRALLDTADAATRMGNRIRIATNSTEEFNAVQQRLRIIADETRAPSESTVNLFARFRVATRDLGTSTEDVLQAVKGLSAAIAVSGATSQEGASALRQLSQGLASGTLRGDELVSVMEGLAPLAQALADELGLTVGQLREFGAEGKLTANVIFPALLRAGQKFIDVFDTLPITLDQAQTVLSNTFTNTIGDINKTIGATEVLATTILDLSKSLRTALIDGFVLATEGAIVLFDILSALTNLLDSLGVKTLPGIGQTFAVFGTVGKVAFEIVDTAIEAIIATIALLVNGFAIVGNAIGLVSDEALALSQGQAGAGLEVFAEGLNETATAADAVAAAFLDIAKNESTTEAQSESFKALAASADLVRQNLEKLKTTDISTLDLTQEGENRTGVVVGKEAQKAIDDQEKALGRVLSITERLRILRAGNVEPLDQELLKLDKQLQTLIAQSEAAKDIGSAAEGLLIIEQEIERIEEQRGLLIEGQARRFEEIRDLIAEAAEVAPEIGTALEAAANAAIAAGGGLEKTNDTLADLIKDAKKDLEEAREDASELAEAFGDNLKGALGNAIRGAITGEGFDAAKLFADIASGFLDDALSSVIDGLGDSLGSLFSGEGFNLFGRDGEGSLIGDIGAAVGAAIGAGATILAGSLAATSVDVTNDLVRSAGVESAAAVRGVIAGPQSIPIFQVGASIEAGFDGAEGLLAEILLAIQEGNVLAAIAAGTGGAAAGLSPGEILSTESTLLT